MDDGGWRRVADPSHTGKLWLEPVIDDRLAEDLGRRFDLPGTIGRLLAGRGIDASEVPTLLDPTLRHLLPDPSHLKGLDEASERLADAAIAGRRWGVLTDYDADGATSGALVTRYARALGIDVHAVVPDRLVDGYGPSPRLLDELIDAGCEPILVLDSGTTAFAALAHAHGRGADVIVVDHHQAEADLPSALAVINPNRQDQESPCTRLAAVGVSFLLLVGVNRTLRKRGFFKDRPEPDLRQWLDLVAVGTVTDVMPLRGLNRAFMIHGLRLLRERANPGLSALCEVAGLKREPGASTIGFLLGPRLNAAGRVAQGGLALDLLSTDDRAEALSLAQQLDGFNVERRGIEKDIVKDAMAAVAAAAQDDATVLIAAREGWHPGVLGIVAGRIAERHSRPALVAGIGADGLAQGSGRAPEGYDLGAALRAAVDAGIAIKAGGHARAGGFTLQADRLEDLSAFLGERESRMALPSLKVDAALASGGASPALMRTLDRLAPFGEGHPQPRFRVLDVRIDSLNEVGGAHLKARLTGADGMRLDAIAFRSTGAPLGEALQAQHQGPPLQACGKLERDSYRGGDAVHLILEDLAPSV